MGNSFRELLAGRLSWSREVAGNSNLGHEFRNAPRGTKGVIGPYLTQKERMAIIEYMKAMPEIKPIDGGAELVKRVALLKEMERQYRRSASHRRFQLQRDAVVPPAERTQIRQEAIQQATFQRETTATRN